MKRYGQPYRLYEECNIEALRAYLDFTDLLLLIDETLADVGDSRNSQAGVHRAGPPHPLRTGVDVFVVGVVDPFALVVGDSKSDLRVMRWAWEHDAGIAAALEHASRDVLNHVLSTDELVFDRRKGTEPLGTVWALNRLADLE